MASRPVLPVTFKGTLAAAGTMMVEGPRPEMPRQNVKPAVQFLRQILGHQDVGNSKRQRANAVAAFCGIDSPDRLQIERIRDQNIEGVCRHSDHATATRSPRAARAIASGEGFSMSNCIKSVAT